MQARQFVLDHSLDPLVDSLVSARRRDFDLASELRIDFRSQRPPGDWCKQNGVTPPPGSFESTNAGLAPGA